MGRCRRYWRVRRRVRYSRGGEANERLQLAKLRQHSMGTPEAARRVGERGEAAGE